MPLHFLALRTLTEHFEYLFEPLDVAWSVRVLLEAVPNSSEELALAGLETLSPVDFSAVRSQFVDIQIF